MQQRVRIFIVVLLLMFAKENFSQIFSLNGSNNFKKNTSIVICDGNGWNTKLYLDIKPEDCIKLPINYNTLKNFDFENRLRIDFLKNLITHKSIPIERIKMNITESLNTKSILRSSFYSENMGIVCKKELQLEKITSVPLRLRLGSLDYTNYLEQKPNALKPLY